MNPANLDIRTSAKQSFSTVRPSCSTDRHKREMQERNDSTELSSILPKSDRILLAAQICRRLSFAGMLWLSHPNFLSI